MTHVFSAFRQKREPLKTTMNTGAITERQEEEGDEPDSKLDAEGAAIEKSLAVFGRLFDLMLSGDPSSEYVMSAFNLTNDVCGRLQPDLSCVKSWVHTLIAALQTCLRRRKRGTQSRTWSMHLLDFYKPHRNGRLT